MTTNTNAALAEAERLLRRDAESLREYYTSHQDRDNWAGEDDAKAGYDEYIRAADALAALTTAAAVPPEGWVMVPVELAQRVQESLGEFLMDHGWSQRDMDTSDDFGAVLLAAAPKAEPVPAGEREELREGASYESMNLAAMVLSDCGHSSNYQPLLERVAGRIDRHVERLLTVQQADRALRAQAAPTTGIPAGWAPLTITHEGQYPEEVAYGPQIMMDRLRKWLDRYFAMLAAPQPAVQQGWDIDAAVEKAWGRFQAAMDKDEPLPPPSIHATAHYGTWLGREAHRHDEPKAGAFRNAARMLAVLEAEIRRLHAELIAAHPAAPVAQGDAEDAARYRWLRDEGFTFADVDLGTDSDGDDFVAYRIRFHLPEPAHSKFEDDEWTGPDIDAAIDAARKQGANHD